ncbi:MAG: DUF523 domain-containing protein [Clostridia bacterium]|nr:DUF523 domain-containing protein [Clostridia bacterium]
MKQRILISACLLGVCCRYDGKSKPAANVEKLMDRYELIPVCPEQLGGLATPRPPAEIRQGRVVTKDGTDVTAQYQKGAEQAFLREKTCGCGRPVLKTRSPGCGSGEVHNGLFAGGLTEGDGITAAFLKQAGITVFGEDQIEQLLSE